jgi:hypothetical protein
LSLTTRHGFGVNVGDAVDVEGSQQRVYLGDDLVARALLHHDGSEGAVVDDVEVGKEFFAIILRAGEGLPDRLL